MCTCILTQAEQPEGRKKHNRASSDDITAVQQGAATPGQNHLLNDCQSGSEANVFQQTPCFSDMLQPRNAVVRIQLTGLQSGYGWHARCICSTCHRPCLQPESNSSQMLVSGARHLGSFRSQALKPKGMRDCNFPAGIASVCILLADFRLKQCRGALRLRLICHHPLLRPQPTADTGCICCATRGCLQVRWLLHIHLCQAQQERP